MQEHDMSFKKLCLVQLIVYQDELQLIMKS